MENKIVTVSHVMDALKFTARMANFNLTDSDIDYMLRKLKGRMSGDEIISALDQINESGGKPTLAAILAYESGGFDSSEIAYAKAIDCFTNESRTAVLNQQITDAWHVAGGLYQEGLSYDASRAFKIAYDEAVRKAKEAGIKKPKPLMMVGTDKVEAEKVTKEAISTGLLPQSSAEIYLPHLTNEEIKNTKEQSSPLLLDGFIQSAIVTDNEYQRQKALEMLELLNGMNTKIIGGER
jgi:hypothetical protein